MAPKPSRSDEVLGEEQQVEITNEVRAHFDSLAPKRPTKPRRSEPDPDAETDLNPPPAVDHDIPELEKLRLLQSQSRANISINGNNITEDDFVETQYYKELDSIDKQHHTTGNGFIKINEGVAENGYNILLEVNGAEANAYNRNNFKSNPATNDWIPILEENQVFVSSKPNRSEG